eukprot:1779072-Ditylum_brightwellii.AAC.1
MEVESASKVEDNISNIWLFDEDDSVELLDNPYTLTEELGREAANIYFQKYADASPGTILG